MKNMMDKELLLFASRCHTTHIRNLEWKIFVIQLFQRRPVIRLFMMRAHSKLFNVKIIDLLLLSPSLLPKIFSELDISARYFL